jgi:hypothetical protein
MREAWELLTAGPSDADRSVLLLPGGANAARSFNLVMADAKLSGVRLVATTLPGMAGAPLSEDVSVPGPGSPGRGAGHGTRMRRGRRVLPCRDGGHGNGAVRALPRPSGAPGHQLDD